MWVLFHRSRFVLNQISICWKLVVIHIESQLEHHFSRKKAQATKSWKQIKVEERERVTLYMEFIKLDIVRVYVCVFNKSYSCIRFMKNYILYNEWVHVVMCKLLRLKYVYFVGSLVTGKQQSTNTIMKHELRLSVTVYKSQRGIECVWKVHVYCSRREVVQGNEL